MSNNAETSSGGGSKYARLTETEGKAHGADVVLEVDPGLVQDVLHGVLTAGDAMLWGTTRDGGAVAIQMFSGDAVDKIYASTSVDLEAALRAIVEAARG